MGSEIAEASQSAASVAPPAPSRPWLKPLIYSLLTLIVIVIACRQLRVSFRAMDWDKVQIRMLPLVGAAACLLLIRLMNAASTELLLRSLGSGVRLYWTAAITFLAAPARYIPAASAAGIIVGLKKRGADLGVVLASTFLSNALMIVISAAVSAPLLATAPIRGKFPAAWIVSAAVVAIGLVCFDVHRFAWLCNLALRKLKRPTLPSDPARKPYFLNLALLLARAFVLGLAGFLTVRSFAPQAPWGEYFAITACMAVATTISFLAVFAPAGVGVQELSLLALTPLLGDKAALLAVMLRLLQVIADLLSGAIGAGMMRWGRDASAAA